MAPSPFIFCIVNIVIIECNKEVIQLPKNDDIQSTVDQIKQNMDTLYQTTYYNSPASNKALEGLTGSINREIDRIVNYNMNTTGMPSVSRLYSRMDISNKTGFKDVGAMFDSAIGFDDFYSNFMQNRYLVEQDEEIDAVCKYFPELLEALDIKKEGVLSADNFSRDYITIMLPESEDESTFNERCRNLKDTYKLLTLVDEIYDATAKYGEQFLYVVPYNAALSRLLTDKPNTMSPDGAFGSGEHFHEAYEDSLLKHKPMNETFRVTMKNTGKDKKTKFTITPNNNGAKPIYVTEATTTIQKKNGKDIVSEVAPMMQDRDSINFDVEIDRSGVIDSIVRENALKNKNKRRLPMSLGVQAEQSFHEKESFKVVKKDKKSGKLVIDGMEDKLGLTDEDPKEGLVADGMYNISGQKNPEIKVKVPGCVVSKVKREQVIPIYIGEDNTCLGYYYIELRSVEAMQDFQGYNSIMGDSLTSLRGNNSAINAPFNVVDPSRQEQMTRFIAAQLSDFIDKEFVQSNQDLREEIYMILKHNDLYNTPSIDKIKITFVPPEDMIHFYFKLDPLTHRGISDLDRAMIPAKIYASLYITDAIAQLCRGQDKRVFYVKQNVENNIAKTMMNTIRQIKQGNFGLRQFSSINNVLNITGKFNDFVIPVGPGGDYPVDINVIPGQQFTDNTERMQQLKEMAVNSTDVPFELVQTRQSADFAVQISMSNSKFLRRIYTRQGQFSPLLSTLCTKLYNYEYHESAKLDVTLPPPIFLNMSNTNSLVQNIKDFVNNISEYDTATMEDDIEKNSYMKELFKLYIGTHIDISKHEKILEKMKAEVEANKKPSKSEEGY